MAFMHQELRIITDGSPPHEALTDPSERIREIYDVSPCSSRPSGRNVSIPAISATPRGLGSGWWRFASPPGSATDCDGNSITSAS
jgi:hypothetical protein